MSKKLKEILKKAEPTTKVSSGDEKFIAKHEVQVTSDANGNDDEVFKASNVKTYDRNTHHHGHNADESESVYESEELCESFKIGKVHHIEHTGVHGEKERSYFIPKEKLKNGRYKGTMFDQGAGGRNRKKPVTRSVDSRFDRFNDWKETPEDEVPEYVWQNHTHGMKTEAILPIKTKWSKNHNYLGNKIPFDHGQKVKLKDTGEMGYVSYVHRDGGKDEHHLYKVDDAANRQKRLRKDSFVHHDNLHPIKEDADQEISSSIKKAYGVAAKNPNSPKVAKHLKHAAKLQYANLLKSKMLPFSDVFNKVKNEDVTGITKWHDLKINSDTKKRQQNLLDATAKKKEEILVSTAAKKQKILKDTENYRKSIYKEDPLNELHPDTYKKVEDHLKNMPDLDKQIQMMNELAARLRRKNDPRAKEAENQLMELVRKSENHDKTKEILQSKLKEETETPKHRPLHKIAGEISKNWKKPYFGAVPYLNAMKSLKTVHDDYGDDSGESVLAYGLSNMNSYSGKSTNDPELAKKHRAELKAHLKDKPKVVSEETESKEKNPNKELKGISVANLKTGKTTPLKLKDLKSWLPKNEETQIDEMKRSKAAHYISQASDEKASVAHEIGYNRGSHSDPTHRPIISNIDAEKKDKKRSQGIELALSKLMHSLNVVYLAKHFGSEQDHKEAMDIMKQHEKEGQLTSDLSKRRKVLHDKLWPKAQNYQNVDKELNKSGVKNKKLYHKILKDETQLEEAKKPWVVKVSEILKRKKTKPETEGDKLHKLAQDKQRQQKLYAKEDVDKEELKRQIKNAEIRMAKNAHNYYVGKGVNHEYTDEFKKEADSDKAFLKKAYKQLKNEEVELNEISKGKLGRLADMTFIKGSAASFKQGLSAGDKDKEENFRTNRDTENRLFKIHKGVVKRLTNNLKSNKNVPIPYKGVEKMSQLGEEKHIDKSIPFHKLQKMVRKKATHFGKHKK